MMIGTDFKIKIVTFTCKFEEKSQKCDIIIVTFLKNGDFSKVKF